MQRNIADDIRFIVSKLQQKKLAEIHAFVGFDACIDNIVRIVNGKDEIGDAQFFTNSR